MQKLKELNTESQDTPRPAPVKVNFEDYPIGFVEALKNIGSLPLNANTTFNAAPQLMIPITHTDAIFHPPSRPV
jgi:hypothetical protein